ncbi:hypothetical protein C8R47DRAFT_1144665 [Mycena vitilis]|nr:hypothetical protein C8R47DRAFT_1144665 [Mycena vitilis]
MDQKRSIFVHKIKLGRNGSWDSTGKYVRHRWPCAELRIRTHASPLCAIWHAVVEMRKIPGRQLVEISDRLLAAGARDLVELLSTIEELGEFWELPDENNVPPPPPFALVNLADAAARAISETNSDEWALQTRCDAFGPLLPVIRTTASAPAAHNLRARAGEAEQPASDRTAPPALPSVDSHDEIFGNSQMAPVLGSKVPRSADSQSVPGAIRVGASTPASIIRPGNHRTETTSALDKRLTAIHFYSPTLYVQNMLTRIARAEASILDGIEIQVLPNDDSDHGASERLFPEPDSTSDSQSLHDFIHPEAGQGIDGAPVSSSEPAHDDHETTLSAAVHDGDLSPAKGKRTMSPSSSESSPSADSHDNRHVNRKRKVVVEWPVSPSPQPGTRSETGTRAVSVKHWSVGKSEDRKLPPTPPRPPPQTKRDSSRTAVTRGKPGKGTTTPGNKRSSEDSRHSATNRHPAAGTGAFINSLPQTQSSSRRLNLDMPPPAHPFGEGESTHSELSRRIENFERTSFGRSSRSEGGGLRSYNRSDTGAARTAAASSAQRSPSTVLHTRKCLAGPVPVAPVCSRKSAPWQLESLGPALTPRPRPRAFMGLPLEAMQHLRARRGAPESHTNWANLQLGSESTTSKDE